MLMIANDNMCYPPHKSAEMVRYPHSVTLEVLRNVLDPHCKNSYGEASFSAPPEGHELHNNSPLHLSPPPMLCGVVGHPCWFHRR